MTRTTIALPDEVLDRLRASAIEERVSPASIGIVGSGTTGTARRSAGWHIFEPPEKWIPCFSIADGLRVCSGVWMTSLVERLSELKPATPENRPLGMLRPRHANAPRRLPE
jgi:hypothetical protein